MTVIIDYTLTPLARISAGKSGQVGNDRAIHEVLPGTAIRGALGTAWWVSPQHRYAGPQPQADFDRLFAEAMTVGPALPVNTTPGARQARLIPLSWVRCKYPQPGCPEGWHDLAAAPLTECSSCGGALEAGKGWDVPREWSVSTTRTALDDMGVALDEQLYTRKSLRDNGFELRGILRLPDVDGLDDAMEWLLSTMEISVGGQRSTMGRCRWVATLRSIPDAELSAGDYAVRLMTPAILVDDYGAPSQDLAGAVLQTVQQSNGRARIGLVRTRPVEVSTWHGIAGLPKPEDWGVEAGAVVVLHDADEVALQSLRAGVGIRRLEGYGMTSLVPLSDVQRRGLSEAISWTYARGVESILGARPAEAAAPRHTGVFPEPTATPHAETTIETPLVPEPVVALGPVETMLAKILDGATRDKTAKGVLAQARNFMRMRDNGFPAAFIKAKVDETANLPWMRDLNGSVQAGIIDILGSDDLALHLEELQRIVRGQ